MKKIILLSSTALGTLLLIVLLCVLNAGTSVAAAPPGEEQNGPDTAHIVVQFDLGNQIVREIQFTAPISGLVALQHSGLEVLTKDSDFGTVVCSIGGVGCPAEDCFCSATKFWSYEHWDGNTWQGYQVGAADTTVGNGAVEGWRWGEWGVGSLPPAPQMLAASKALDWMQAQQDTETGGYGSDTNAVEALLTIGANGWQAADWRREDSYTSLLHYWMGKSSAYARKGAAESGKLMSALVAADGCLPPLTLRPTDYYSPTAGYFDSEAGFHVWGILGSVAISQPVPSAASEYLKGLVQPDGGWEWNAGFSSDTNATALAIQALVAAGEPLSSTLIVNGLNYLESTQNIDGGFPYDPDSPYGTDSDTNSTSYVVQAILATGGDPLTGTWIISNSNPISYLLGMQLPEGSFEWQPGFGANMVATQQAITALLGRSHPYRVAEMPTCPSVFLPVVTTAVKP